VTDDDKIDAIVDALTRAENQLTGPAYDGVFGRLPEWIPANFHVDFHKIRGRLLEAYSHTDLLGYIAEYLAMDENPETYSIPGEIMLDVSLLAHYQEAVRLAEKVRQEKERELLADDMEPKKAALKARMEGEKAGLALLTDPEHAGQVEHGKKFTSRKPRSYAPWKKWIERKLKKDIALKPAALWELFKAKPLRGWRAVESAKIGQYLESPTGSDDDVTYKRFQDAVGEVRRDLKKG
jgi:hypothetical protein